MIQKLFFECELESNYTYIYIRIRICIMYIYLSIYFFSSFSPGILPNNPKICEIFCPMTSSILCLIKKKYEKCVLFGSCSILLAPQLPEFKYVNNSGSRVMAAIRSLEAGGRAGGVNCALYVDDSPDQPVLTMALHRNLAGP